LKKYANGKSYIVQQGITLEKTKGNPFDLRVMVQKPNKDQWIPSAIFSKIGKPGKVVTNYHQGGKIGTLQSTLQGAGYSPNRIKETETRLKQLGLDVGHCFDTHKRNFRELGLDVALDTTGRIWIFEVKYSPCFLPSKKCG
jgi:hypothetical protein